MLGHYTLNYNDGYSVYVCNRPHVSQRAHNAVYSRFSLWFFLYMCSRCTLHDFVPLFLSFFNTHPTPFCCIYPTLPLHLFNTTARHHRNHLVFLLFCPVTHTHTLQFSSLYYSFPLSLSLKAQNFILRSERR